MAKAWKDVIASPQYQALTEEQKAQAQAQYFDEVVAPKAGDKWAGNEISFMQHTLHLSSRKKNHH